MYKTFLEAHSATASNSMSEKLKIGLVLGSTRENRLCDQVAKFVRKEIEKEHEVVIFDPLEVDLPQSQQSPNFFYNPSAVPQNIKDLNEKFKAVDAIVFVCPEYNWSLPPGLTNLMDNIPPTTFAYKPCGYVNYSVGEYGGMRSGMQLRVYSAALGLIGVPCHLGLPKAHEILDKDGNCKDESKISHLQILLQHVYWMSHAFKHEIAKVPTPKWILS